MKDWKKLSEIYHQFPAFWLWADIDGDGRCWNLCVIGRDEYADDGIVVDFVGKDFNDFYPNYADYPAIGIAEPLQYPG